MFLIRILILRHKYIAILIVALALFVKALVPSGYMIANTGTKFLTVQICADVVNYQKTMQIAIPMQSETQDSHSNNGKAESTCAFTSLSMASFGGLDVALLAIALAFILALGYAALALKTTKKINRLRPPLRGPPAFI